MTGMHTFPLGVHKLTTSAYSPSGNGGVERVYYTMTGMNTFSTSNKPAITPLARQQASLPMNYTSDAYRAPPTQSSIAPMVEPIRALNATISPIATLPENGNSAPTSSCMNSMLLQSLVLTDGTLPSRTRFSVIFSFWATGPTHHQPRARSSSPKVNITSREPTD